MATPSLRCDAPLIRHISTTTDPMMGRLWQDLPIICVPEDVWYREMQRSEELNYAGYVSWRPFNDFILYFDSMLDRNALKERKPCKMWCRVTTSSNFISTFRRMYGNVECPELAINDLVFNTWILAYDGKFYHELVEVCTSSPGGYNVWRYGDIPAGTEISSEWADRCRTHASLASNFIVYLSLCSEYLVEERPAGCAPKRRDKDVKPWTYTHLPRIILLDPKACPKVPKDDQGGSHATPRPHQRRGHWRRLLAARYRNRGSHIFVKPAWIGPREWVLNGSVYRALDEANRPQPKGPTSIERAVMDALDARRVSYEPQKPIGRCIVDIFIAPNTVIEVDGKYWHNLPGAKERDARRDAWLRSRGYVVHRLSEDDVTVDALAAVNAVLGG